jgi:hypothetical protein
MRRAYLRAKAQFFLSPLLPDLKSGPDTKQREARPLEEQRIFTDLVLLLNQLLQATRSSLSCPMRHALPRASLKKVGPLELHTQREL